MCWQFPFFRKNHTNKTFDDSAQFEAYRPHLILIVQYDVRGIRRLHIPGLRSTVGHVPVYNRSRSDSDNHSHIGRLLLARFAVGIGAAVVHRGAPSCLHGLRTSGVGIYSGWDNCVLCFLEKYI